MNEPLKIPRIIPQSKGLKKIQHPGDFRLDGLVEGIWSYVDYIDFFISGDMKMTVEFAKDIIFNPETDPKIIQDRQELFTEFSSPKFEELREFIINKNKMWISVKEPHDFLSKQGLKDNRTFYFLDYITGLAQKLPKTDNPYLENFRKHIVELSNGEKIKALRDIKESGTLEIKTRFYAPHKLFGKDITKYKMTDTEVKATFASGKTQNISYETDSNKYQNSPNLDYLLESILEETCKNIEVNSGTPVDVEVLFDEKSKKATGKIRYEEGYKVGSYSIPLLNKKTKNIEIEFEDCPFKKTMKHLKEEPHSDFLEDILSDMLELESTVTELRYLAIGADYFKRLKEKEIQTTMPEIEPMDSNITQITKLLNPVYAIEHPDYVQDEVQDDGNLSVMTGPLKPNWSYMRTLVMTQLLFQAGMWVTAEKAKMSPKDQIFVQDITWGRRSKYRSYYSELSDIEKIFEEATGYSLVMMYNPFSRSTPETGKRETGAIIEALHRIGATAYVATHFPDVSKIADKLPFARNLHSESYREGNELVCTGKIKEGPSYKSHHMYNPDKMGLMDILTKRAEAGEITLR